MRRYPPMDNGKVSKLNGSTTTIQSTKNQNVSGGSGDRVALTHQSNNQQKNPSNDKGSSKSDVEHINNVPKLSSFDRKPSTLAAFQTILDEKLSNSTTITVVPQNQSNCAHNAHQDHNHIQPNRNNPKDQNASTTTSFPGRSMYRPLPLMSTSTVCEVPSSSNSGMPRLDATTKNLISSTSGSHVTATTVSKSSEHRSDNSSKSDVTIKKCGGPTSGSQLTVTTVPKSSELRSDKSTKPSVTIKKLVGPALGSQFTVTAISKSSEPRSDKLSIADATTKKIVGLNSGSQVNATAIAKSSEPRSDKSIKQVPLPTGSNTTSSVRNGTLREASSETKNDGQFSNTNSRIESFRIPNILNMITDTNASDPNYNKRINNFDRSEENSRGRRSNSVPPPLSPRDVVASNIETETKSRSRSSSLTSKTLRQRHIQTNSSSIPMPPPKSNIAVDMKHRHLYSNKDTSRDSEGSKNHHDGILVVRNPISDRKVKSMPKDSSTLILPSQNVLQTFRNNAADSKQEITVVTTTQQMMTTTQSGGKNITHHQKHTTTITKTTNLDDVAARGSTHSGAAIRSITEIVGQKPKTSSAVSSSPLQLKRWKTLVLCNGPDSKNQLVADNAIVANRDTKTSVSQTGSQDKYIRHQNALQRSDILGISSTPMPMPTQAQAAAPKQNEMKKSQELEQKKSESIKMNKTVQYKKPLTIERQITSKDNDSSVLPMNKHIRHFQPNGFLANASVDEKRTNSIATSEKTNTKIENNEEAATKDNSSRGSRSLSLFKKKSISTNPLLVAEPKEKVQNNLHVAASVHTTFNNAEKKPGTIARPSLDPVHNMKSYPALGLTQNSSSHKLPCNDHKKMKARDDSSVVIESKKEVKGMVRASSLECLQKKNIVHHVSQRNESMTQRDLRSQKSTGATNKLESVQQKNNENQKREMKHSSPLLPPIQHKTLAENCRNDHTDIRGKQEFSPLTKDVGLYQTREKKHSPLLPPIQLKTLAENSRNNLTDIRGKQEFSPATKDEGLYQTKCSLQAGINSNLYPSSLGGALDGHQLNKPVVESSPKIQINKNSLISNKTNENEEKQETAFKLKQKYFEHGATPSPEVSIFSTSKVKVTVYQGDPPPPPPPSDRQQARTKQKKTGDATPTRKKSLTVEVNDESDSKQSRSVKSNGDIHDDQREKRDSMPKQRKEYLSKRQQSDKSQSFYQNTASLVITPVRSFHQQFWKSNSEETDCDTAPVEMNPNKMVIKDMINNSTLNSRNNQDTMSVYNDTLSAQTNLVTIKERDQPINVDATRLSFETNDSNVENPRCSLPSSGDRKTIVERSRHARKRRSEIREKLQQSHCLFQDKNNEEISEHSRAISEHSRAEFFEKQEVVDSVCTPSLDEVDGGKSEGHNENNLMTATKPKNLFNSWKNRAAMNRDDVVISEVTNIRTLQKSGDIKHGQPEVGTISFVKRIFGGKR